LQIKPAAELFVYGQGDSIRLFAIVALGGVVAWFRAPVTAERHRSIPHIGQAIVENRFTVL
jgi:hypothetical protein